MGRPRRRWEDNITMDIEEIGINAGNWDDSAQDRNYWRALVNAALNLRVSLVMEIVFADIYLLLTSVIFLVFLRIIYFVFEDPFYLQLALKFSKLS